MRPFYRFTLDTETGEVKRLKITDYEQGRPTPYSTNIYYRYRTTHFCYAYSTDFETFKNNRVYSWNDDIEKAKLIIAQSLLAKAKIFDIQATRCKTIVKKMRDFCGR